MLCERSIPADVVAHVAWHHLAADRLAQLAPAPDGSSCADALFFDGTLWDDDEMIRMGLGQKTGRRMGHMPATETMDVLRPVAIGRRIFVHMNNSNPLTDPASPQSATAQAQGWQVGRDGMEITL